MDDRLELLFKDGEQLTIWSPDGYYADDNVLRLERASRIRWEWRSAHDVHSREYRPPSDGDAGSVDPPDLAPDWTMPAVEIWFDEYDE